jgi:hypothetical protein
MRRRDESPKKDYLVSIDVVSRTSTLSDLTRRIGVAPHASSHEKGP